MDESNVNGREKAEEAHIHNRDDEEKVKEVEEVEMEEVKDVEVEERRRRSGRETKWEKKKKKKRIKAVSRGMKAPYSTPTPMERTDRDPKDYSHSTCAVT